MKFNIARQPLVPAFLTLAAITALAMWKVPLTGEFNPENLSIPTRGVLAVRTLEELLAAFQGAFPGWTRAIGAMLMLFTGMSLGRLTLRYNLYSVGTCLAIPLYAAFTTGLALGGELLQLLVANTLLALSVKNFARSFCNGYAFDALFRASLYLGLLLLAAPAALPLIALLPLAIILFHRTLRETVVALAGLLLPILAFGYVNWGAGGDFTAPFELAAEAFMNGSALEAARAIPIPNLILLGALVLLDLLALFYFLADSYAAGNKPRAIFIFQIFLLILLIPTLLNPVSTPGEILLLAVPSAILIPFLLVRIHRLPTLVLYLLLTLGSLGILFLQ